MNRNNPVKEAKQIPEMESKEWSQFESLLAELSARFINLPSDKVDSTIEDAQRVYCERFGLDRSCLFKCVDGGACLPLTHMYQRPGLPFKVLKQTDSVLGCHSYWHLNGHDSTEPLMRIDCKALYPWFYEQARSGETVVVSDVSGLGKAASSDKENLDMCGTQSVVVVPLFMNGIWLGILTFGAVRYHRTWPYSLVKRFQCLGDIFTNALARKRADQALRDSEARFRTVADSAPVLIWMSGTDRLCNFFNKPWLDFTGRTLEQEMGNGWAQGVYKEDLAACLKTYVESFEARRSFTMQYRLRRHDGEYRWVSDNGIPRYDAEGKFAGYIGSCVDITERRKAEEALRQSEERFRQVAEHVGDFIWEIDAAGLYTYTSPSVEKILHYATDELVGKMRFYDLFVPEIRESLKAAVFRMFAEKLSFRDFPNVNLCKEGSKIHLETSGAPILDASGNLVGYRGASKDVSARTRAEAELRRSWAEIQQLKDRLQAEHDYLQTEIKVIQSFGEIIGETQAVKQVLRQIEQVAPVDCPVLIAGETGTGKELIARAIHRLSPRRERAMIKVNCAALPSTLLESEMFGHEKGAFTSAISRQAGRFELANGSTIFLDEIGELSLEVQAKLLRVLQEGEFERLGSPKVHRVNARVLAVTNRDLAEEVRMGRFRQDLYYRLNVFPIAVPPLRERMEDIPALVSAFVDEFCSRTGRKITKMPRWTMDALQHYSWPGNIRELRNILERGVILSTDEVLRIPPLNNPRPTSALPKTLVENEREHILKTFEKTRGRIKGPNGAAELLGMNPGTLYSRMKKLGIPNPRHQDGLSTQS